jgi:hypothetical protein
VEYPSNVERFENSLKYLKPRLTFRCGQRMFEARPSELTL